MQVDSLSVGVPFLDPHTWILNSMWSKIMWISGTPSSNCHQSLAPLTTGTSSEDQGIWIPELPEWHFQCSVSGKPLEVTIAQQRGKKLTAQHHWFTKCVVILGSFSMKRWLAVNKLPWKTACSTLAVCFGVHSAYSVNEVQWTCFLPCMDYVYITWSWWHS